MQVALKTHGHSPLLHQRAVLLGYSSTRRSSLRFTKQQRPPVLTLPTCVTVPSPKVRPVLTFATSDDERDKMEARKAWEQAVASFILEALKMQATLSEQAYQDYFNNALEALKLTSENLQVDEAVFTFLTKVLSRKENTYRYIAIRLVVLLAIVACIFFAKIRTPAGLVLGVSYVVYHLGFLLASADYSSFIPFKKSASSATDFAEFFTFVTDLAIYRHYESRGFTTGVGYCCFILVGITLKSGLRWSRGEPTPLIVKAIATNVFVISLCMLWLGPMNLHSIAAFISSLWWLIYVCCKDKSKLGTRGRN